MIGAKPQGLFKKLFASISLDGLLAAGLGAMPAKAADSYAPVGVDQNTVREVVYNTPIDLDYSCQGASTNQGVQTTPDQPPMPTGLYYDTADGHIKGTPTGFGLVDLPLVLCGITEFQINIGYAVGKLRIVAEPAPILLVTPLGDQDCNVRVTMMFPFAPDPGASLSLGTGDNYVIAWLKHYDANQIVDFTFSGNNIASIGQQGVGVADSIGQGSGGQFNYCGQELDMTLTYQSNSLVPNSSSTTVSPWATAQNTNQGPQAYLTAAPMNNSTCGISITGWISAVADPGSITLDLFSFTENKVLTLTLRDAQPNQEIDIYVSGSHLENLVTDAWVASANGVMPFDTCGSALGLDLTYAVGGSQTDYSTSVTPQFGSAVNPFTCEPGTFSVNGDAPCSQASAGHYVSTFGATEEVPCALGYFASGTGSSTCERAEVGFYVDSVGAITSKACPTGMITFLRAARSHFECYKVLVQTIKAVKLPAKGKFGTKLLMPKTTDLGAPLTVVATGPCKVATVKVPAVVKGKKTKVAKYQVTLGKVAGTCSLALANAGDETHQFLSATKTINVAKK